MNNQLGLGVFAAELHERLLWFTRLRWWAIVGLLAGAWLGPLIGFPPEWSRLAAVAAFSLAANLYFRSSLARRGDQPRAFGALQRSALLQMCTDLAALLVAVHITGGLESPLTVFFVFHMAIGTIMIAAELMYLIALGTSWCILCLLIMEAKGLVAHHAIDPGGSMSGRVSGLSMLALTAALFGTVYLTDSVARRFRRRTVQLHERTIELDQKKAALEDACDTMKRLEERKSKFMLLSAHQLRSPLGTVRTSLDVLAEGYVDPGSERGRRLIEGSVERVDGLLAIVNDLLELAKLREGAKRAPWAPRVNVAQLVVDVTDALTTVAEARGITLEANADPVAVLEWGIPPDLVFAIENLIQNAIKYSRSGGRVSVDLTVSDGVARLAVADQGIGIPADFVSTLFTEFARAQNARRHTAEGTGLGLAIVQEVVAAHHGAVSVVSHENVGSTFTVTLPLARRESPVTTV
ncbi:MAG: sensor histidine kinase [Acidobacteriota bacterium]